MLRKITEGRTLGLKYEIYDSTGIVDQTERHTEKHSVIRNETTVNGVKLPEFGIGTPLETAHQNIHLQGEESSVELENLEVPCSRGERLTMFLLRHGHEKDGSYFRFLNHSTRKAVDNPRAIRDELFPWASFWVLLTLSIFAVLFNMILKPDTLVSEAIFVAAFCAPIFAVPVYFLGWWVAFFRTQAVRRNRKFRSYVDGLRDQLQSRHSPAV